jgi:hypothetical protein
LAPFRQLWSAHVDALERHLARVDQTARPKGKKAKTRQKQEGRRIRSAK